MEVKSFKNYPLATEIIESLDALGYQTPTEVQEVVLDLFEDKQDLVVLSQTGSGKTAAFGIPMINDIDWHVRDVQALVLVPTRELAQQVQKELFQIGRYKRLNVVSVFGKDSMKRQVADLSQRAHIVVGTPGRILDHIANETIDLSHVSLLVLDEADEMMNLGFQEPVTDIARSLPYHRTIMLSATMNPKIETIITKTLRAPQIVEVSATSDVKLRIDQRAVLVDVDHKMEALLTSLAAFSVESAIVFCNQKHTVDAVNEFLRSKGVDSRKLHGGMDQKSRTLTMNNFKQGVFRYLIATDVAARGLDIDNIQTIVNYDIPDHGETYTHRIGRTARMDLEGFAISLVTRHERAKFRDEFAKDATITDVRALDLQDADFHEFMKMQKSKRTMKKTATHYDDIMKLHIKAGKNQKMRAGDIVGSITAVSGVLATDIGVIQVLEESTYVEILNHKGKQVLKQLQELPIKGKKRRVEVATRESL